VGFSAITFDCPHSLLESEIPATDACLVLDVHLPEMTGVELSFALSAAGCRLPVILITGYRDQATSELAGRANPFALLFKPFTRKALLDAISGALAGLAGMSEVNGSVHRLQDHISPGYGFTAIIVAYLAKFRPGRVIVAAILFGALILAGREIQPSGVPAMIQGIILFTLIVADVLVRYRIRISRGGPATATPTPTPAVPEPGAGG
jgi:simple sugar transport system permease protein